mmetsp:Transcript_20016/g.46595  ORF Transcript_20016/g.46595 Transcript_20016/m.46595 type:complete len:996 (+) Transcript_20016:35-3022(+)
MVVLPPAVTEASQVEDAASQAAQQLQPRLCLRGTFIDLRENVDLAPRAHSEPSRKVANLVDEFEEEQTYVESLRQRELFLRSELRLSQRAGAQSSGTSEERSTKAGRSRKSKRSPQTSSESPGDALQATGSSQSRSGEGDQDDSRSTCSMRAGAASVHGDEDRAIDVEGSAKSSSARRPPGTPRGKEAAKAGGHAPARERQREVVQRRSKAWDQRTNCSHEIATGGFVDSEEQTDFGRKTNDFFLGRSGPRSEPAQHAFDRRRGKLPEYIDQSHGSDVPGEGRSSSGSESNFKNVAGTWAGNLGVWTIQDNGRALFEGGHMGNKYDLGIKPGGDGTIISRGDGWTVDQSQSTQNTLVWTTSTPGEEMTWRRVTQDRGRRETGQSRSELRAKMSASAQSFNAGWSSERRRSSALAAFEAIPIRIGDDMSKATSRMVDDVRVEITAMRNHMNDIRKESATNRVDTESRLGVSVEEEKGAEEWDEAAAKVVKHLEAIPAMILNLLEARVGKAKQTVRHRVQGMMKNLSAIQEESFVDDNEELASQMQLISDEVETIAGEAVEAAAHECRAHAARQLDFALMSLKDANLQYENTKQELRGRQPPQEKSSVVMGSRTPFADKKLPSEWGGKWADWRPENLASAPLELWPEMPAATHSSGASSSDGDTGGTSNVKTGKSYFKTGMAEAVAMIRDIDYVPKSMANQFVADELLRAKATRRSPASLKSMSVRGDADENLLRENSEVQVATNPGSIGHPDLCQRPCVYFSAGNCTASQECSFCHMMHPKRPVRLDKRHRETLKSMKFEDLLMLVLPVLRQKLSDVPRQDEVDLLLDRLGALAAASSAGSGVPTASALEAQQKLWEGGSNASSSVAFNRKTSSRRQQSSAQSDVSECSNVPSAASGGRRRDNFAGALQVMGLRSLLTTVSRLAPDGSEQVQQLLQQVLSLSYEAHSYQPGMGPQSEAGVSLLGSEASRDPANVRRAASSSAAGPVAKVASSQAME